MFQIFVLPARSYVEVSPSRTYTFFLKNIIIITGLISENKNNTLEFWSIEADMIFETSKNHPGFYFLFYRR